jgi:pimeloyl-ACP methyl ester carboxylesterase
MRLFFHRLLVMVFLSLCLAPAPVAAADMLNRILDADGNPDDAETDIYRQPTPPEPPSIEAAGIETPQVPGISGRERVVILHGIGRSSMSMADIARALRAAGYKDDNIGYNSTRDVLRTIIDDVYNRIRYYSDKPDEKVHFVCYSLGCLVTRGVIEQHRPANLGHVVMLGPPNQGSEMADYLKDHAVSRWLFGPNLPQLGTANRRMLEKLIGDDADYTLGIIAGQDSLDPVGAAILPDADDGRVPVERTKLPGMNAHLVMDANHTTLITNDAVIAEAVHFIQHGKFSDDQQQPE